MLCSLVNLISLIWEGLLLREKFLRHMTRMTSGEVTEIGKDVRLELSIEKDFGVARGSW